MKTRILFSVVLSLCVWTGQGVAQETAGTAVPGHAAAEEHLAAEQKVETSVQSLEALLKSVQSKKTEIVAVQQKLPAAPDEVTRAELVEELTKLKEESAHLNQQFAEFAVAVDISAFVEEEKKEFNWQEELGAILQPIIAEVKNATAESRIIGELRAAAEEQATRVEVAEQAVANLNALMEATLSPELTARLTDELAVWTQRRNDARNRQTALNLQLENRLAERASVLDATTGYAQNFFRTRGMNLVYGIGSFCLVFFGVRLIGGMYRKLHSSKKGESFSSRLGALLFHFFSIIGGLLASLLVFNMAGDWFLMGIVVIFLLGVGWASINTLPQHVETVKLMLNIGAVKEGERLVFDGIPWQVDRLSFGVRLVNPLLDGGLQTMPVKYLVGMHSRPSGKQEEWFPSRQGDWVELSDGRMGRVSYQTPSAVQLTGLGGSQTILQTPDYLALSPRNLSTGFRITTSFGIDYRHQPDSADTIPDVMQQKLTADLAELVGADQLNSVRVYLSEAGASSLDYAIDVDVAGEAAPQRDIIRRAISRALVEACNEHGWVIPFPQLTLHQA